MIRVGLAYLYCLFLKLWPPFLLLGPFHLYFRLPFLKLQVQVVIILSEKGLITRDGQ